MISDLSHIQKKILAFEMIERSKIVPISFDHSDHSFHCLLGLGPHFLSVFIDIPTNIPTQIKTVCRISVRVCGIDRCRPLFVYPAASSRVAHVCKAIYFFIALLSLMIVMSRIASLIECGVFIGLCVCDPMTIAAHLHTHTRVREICR